MVLKSVLGLDGARIYFHTIYSPRFGAEQYYSTVLYGKDLFLFNNVSLRMVSSV